MKIESGKYYERADGKKAGPASNGGSGGPHPWIVPTEYGDHFYYEDGRSCYGIYQARLVAEWTEHPEQGTLKEILAKHGDRVQDRNGDEADVVMHEGRICVFYEGWLEPEPRDVHDGFCIITRASDRTELTGGIEYHGQKFRITSYASAGPVRTVTTRLVPNECVIGHVEVTKHGKVWMRHVTTHDELTAAITTLTQIRDAMEDKK